MRVLLSPHAQAGERSHSTHVLEGAETRTVLRTTRLHCRKLAKIRDIIRPTIGGDSAPRARTRASLFCELPLMRSLLVGITTVRYLYLRLQL